MAGVLNFFVGRKIPQQGVSSGTGLGDHSVFKRPRIAGNGELGFRSGGTYLAGVRGTGNSTTSVKSYAGLAACQKVDFWTRALFVRVR